MTDDPPELVERFFDDYGEREWRLARFVAPGAEVLEIGAGAGRFTIELVRLGASVHVGDISPVQLDPRPAHRGTGGR